ncbi:MAG: hypothetical protein WCN86_02275 [bacterium]
MKNLYSRYKKIIWGAIILLIASFLVWVMYIVLVFQVLSITPSQNSKISGGSGQVTFNFNRDLDTIDLGKQMYSSEGLSISAQVDKNKLTLFISNINQAKKYQIQLKEIRSKEGNTISYINYQFEGAFVPYGQLSDSEKNRQIKETDKGNLQDPVMGILPKYGDNYAIKYELFGEPSQKGKYIKLNIILLLDAQNINNKDLAKQYKNEALDFLKSNNINPNDYVIKYDPDYATGL